MATMLTLLGASAVGAQNVQHTGQRATDPFPLTAGLATFDIAYRGTGPFAARLLDQNGALVEQLAVSEGPFEGSKAVRIPRDGRYLYDVSGTGSWSIQLRGADPSGSAGGDMTATYAGMAAGRGVGSGRWLATGFVGGALLGPLGAGINLALASRRDVLVPPHVEAAARSEAAGREEEFLAAYRARVRSNRRTAAFVGGATGTLVFAFALLQVLNWDNSSGGDSGGPGGEVP